MKHLRPIYTYRINEESGVKDIITGLSILASILIGNPSNSQSLNSKEMQNEISKIIKTQDIKDLNLPEDKSKALVKNQKNISKMLDSMSFSDMIKMYNIKNKMSAFKIPGHTIKDTTISGDGVNFLYY